MKENYGKFTIFEFYNIKKSNHAINPGISLTRKTLKSYAKTGYPFIMIRHQ